MSDTVHLVEKFHTGDQGIRDGSEAYCRACADCWSGRWMALQESRKKAGQMPK